MMRKKEVKKDHSNIIVCPRCGAGNLTIQSSCGRCGFVFPKEKVKFKGRPGELPETGRAGQMPNGLPPGVTLEPGRPPMDAMGGAGGEEGEPSEPPKPKRPQQMPEKGVSESIHKGESASVACPRCGMDVKPDAKRCAHCGWRR